MSKLPEHSTLQRSLWAIAALAICALAAMAIRPEKSLHTGALSQPPDTLPSTAVHDAADPEGMNGLDMARPLSSDMESREDASNSPITVALPGGTPVTVRGGFRYIDAEGNATYFNEHGEEIDRPLSPLDPIMDALRVGGADAMFAELETTEIDFHELPADALRQFTNILTMHMDADRLQHILEDGRVRLHPSAASLVIRRRDAQSDEEFLSVQTDIVRQLRLLSAAGYALDTSPFDDADPPTHGSNTFDRAMSAGMTDVMDYLAAAGVQPRFPANFWKACHISAACTPEVQRKVIALGYPPP